MTLLSKFSVVTRFFRLLRGSKSAEGHLGSSNNSGGHLALISDVNFNNLIEKIIEGYEICTEDITPYICSGRLVERIQYNLALANAYFRSGIREGAKVCIQRVWLLSGMDVTYLPKFIEIHAAYDDIDAIRDAYKQLGMRSASENNILQSLNYFNSWQYAYSFHRGLDDYRYDYEVLNRISELASPYRFDSKRRVLDKMRKIQVGYLVYGITHLNSVLVKICSIFGEHHDKLRFAIKFYVPEKEVGSSVWVVNKKMLEKFGWEVVVSRGGLDNIDSLVGLARSINKSNTDVLVVCAGLADFRHYFITALSPAPVIIGLCQGPPPQFIAPSFDYSISWYQCLVPDCPTDCKTVSLRVDLPDTKYSREEVKKTFGIQPGDLVVMLCGRPPKLQDANFLTALIDLVESHETVWLVIVGIEELPNGLAEKLKHRIAERIKVIGWEKNFHRVLSMADVLVDTYPSGGGVVVKDAMALGIPVVSFEHDYMKIFNQKECSASDEVIGLPELVVRRGDFKAMVGIVSRLLNDELYREYISNKCKVRISETAGDPEIMVRECEEIYSDVFYSNWI